MASSHERPWHLRSPLWTLKRKRIGQKQMRAKLWVASRKVQVIVGGQIMLKSERPRRTSCPKV